MMKILSEDSTNHIMEVPFASVSMYDQEVIQNWETEQENLKDGNLYIVFKANSQLNSIFGNESSLAATKLDELYLPEPADTNLQLQAIANAGNTTVEELRIRLCLFKQPHGRIRYLDTETQSHRNVPNIKVWALAFGIPVVDHTDNSGYYWIPWAFSAGTLMGIHAENSHMKVMPFNTVGGFFSVVGQLTTNFILGSRRDFGWYSSCQMKNEINVDYNIHNQQRYWCHIMNAVKLHYDYTSQDGIFHAPNVMVCYAHWADNTGSASTPMLGHIQTNTVAYRSQFLGVIFGTNLNVTAPNLLQLMTGLVPDMTLKYSATESDYGTHNSGNSRFSEDLMQTTFHELSHASLYRKVGQLWWQGIISQIVANNGYGNGTGAYWGLTQVNEAWAEFYGKIQHQRHHPNGHALVRLAGSGGNSWQPYPIALENVPWFFDNWINTGIFYDLMDGNNEPFDQLSGYSIANMYHTFNPNTDGFCDWRDDFIDNFPNINQTNLRRLMVNQNEWNERCGSGWINPIW